MLVSSFNRDGDSADPETLPLPLLSLSLLPSPLAFFMFEGEVETEAASTDNGNTHDMETTEKKSAEEDGMADGDDHAVRDNRMQDRGNRKILRFR